MANSIKESAGGLALQVTTEAREAGLVDEDADGNATRLADVYVYGFDGLLLVVDAETVSVADRAKLVGSALGDSGAIHRGEAASVQIAGNGYQVQLPGCRAAGFHQGDDALVSTAPGILVIHGRTQSRLASDLTTIRQEQVAAQ